MEFEIVCDKSKFEVFPGAFIYKKQFSITIAYAVTIHKSQRMSLDFCIADIGNSTFPCGYTEIDLCSTI